MRGREPERCVWDGCMEPRLCRSLYCLRHERYMLTDRKEPVTDDNCQARSTITHPKPKAGLEKK